MKNKAIYITFLIMVNAVLAMEQEMEQEIKNAFLRSLKELPVISDDNKGLILPLIEKHTGDFIEFVKQNKVTKEQGKGKQFPNGEYGIRISNKFPYVTWKNLYGADIFVSGDTVTGILTDKEDVAQELCGILDGYNKQHPGQKPERVFDNDSDDDVITFIGFCNLCFDSQICCDSQKMKRFSIKRVPTYHTCTKTIISKQEYMEIAKKSRESIRQRLKFYGVKEQKYMEDQSASSITSENQQQKKQEGQREQAVVSLAEKIEGFGASREEIVAMLGKSRIGFMDDTGQKQPQEQEIRKLSEIAKTWGIERSEWKGNKLLEDVKKQAMEGTGFPVIDDINYAKSKLLDWKKAKEQEQQPVWQEFGFSSQEKYEKYLELLELQDKHK
ncbi:MAG: hypothetical protein ACTSXG_04350 [Alphaproteobacteria bacterium]